MVHAFLQINACVIQVTLVKLAHHHCAVFIIQLIYECVMVTDLVQLQILAFANLAILEYSANKQLVLKNFILIIRLVQETETVLTQICVYAIRVTLVLNATFQCALELQVIFLMYAPAGVLVLLQIHADAIMIACLVFGMVHWTAQNAISIILDQSVLLSIVKNQ